MVNFKVFFKGFLVCFVQDFICKKLNKNVKKRFKAFVCFVFFLGVYLSCVYMYNYFCIYINVL